MFRIYLFDDIERFYSDNRIILFNDFSSSKIIKKERNISI